MAQHVGIELMIILSHSLSTCAFFFWEEGVMVQCFMTNYSLLGMMRLVIMMCMLLGMMA